ncbi:MAG: hypothetical protein HDQ88_09095 [Clostridia bacterium]|nr:hypothetical protein [Clostridia bacterium]
MKTKTIKTKQELHWHIISNYLESISNFRVAHTDEKFKKLLNEIQSYVDEKLATDCDGDILEICVVVSQKPEN